MFALAVLPVVVMAPRDRQILGLVSAHVRHSRADWRRVRGRERIPLSEEDRRIWLVANTIVETPKDSAIGAGIILLGLPGYYYWRRVGAGR